MQQMEPVDLTNSKKIARLWIHEVWRVLGDRLIADDDEEWLYSEIIHVLKTKIREDLTEVLKNGKEDIKLSSSVNDLKHFRFTDVMGEQLSASERNYDECVDSDALCRRVETYLEDFNTTSKKPMNITMFEFAMDQCLRICRVLRLSRGNAALLGLGGSGRQT